MSEPVTTEMRERSGRWPGLVWALPIAALLIVGYLGLRAFAQRGVDVVVTFANSGGAQVGDTKVIYLGVDSGRVTKISVNPDGKRVDMVLRLTPKAKSALTTTTTFWLVGATPSIIDVSSLKAVVAGVSIGAAPGVGGTPTRRFNGLMQPPPVIPGTPGRTFQLSAEKIGSLRAGSSVFYRGLDVGKVTALDLAGLKRFSVSVFLKAPYDGLVRPDSLFWLTSPLQVDLGEQGITTQLAPGNASLAGGVDVETPDRAAAEPEAGSDVAFTLYADRGGAIAGGRGPQLAYALTFPGGVRDLKEGAAVKLAGRQIGAVRDVGFEVDGDTGEIAQPVTIAIRPDRLHLRHVDLAPEGDWRPVADAAMARLVARGYRARLVQSPPVIGPYSISLEQVAKPRRAVFTPGSPEPTLPTVASADVSGLTDKASDILDKIDRIPLTEIGADVRRITARLDRLVNSPQVSDSLAHLDSTLTQVDAIAREVKPQVGPLVAKLNTAADQVGQTATAANGLVSGQGAAQGASLTDAVRELTDTARSLRALADYLGRHPEAVLRGKVKERR